MLIELGSRRRLWSRSDVVKSKWEVRNPLVLVMQCTSGDVNVCLNSRPKDGKIKYLLELEVLKKNIVQITQIRLIQYENMTAFGAWHVFQFVLHRQSR